VLATFGLKIWVTPQSCGNCQMQCGLSHIRCDCLGLLLLSARPWYRNLIAPTGPAGVSRGAFFHRTIVDRHLPSVTPRTQTRIIAKTPLAPGKRE
jgi:hypothetical protein